MPGWSYDPKSKRYRRENGQFVAFEQVVAWAYDYADASGDFVANLVSQSFRQGLRPTEFGQVMRQEIRKQHINQYVLGRGGLEQMTQRDWGRVGWLLREQYRYLDNFIEEIASGKLSEGQIRARARMYIDAAHEAFERARSEAFGLPLMPAYPGDGQSRCLTKCRCNWRHEEVREHGKLTGWRSTWQLNPADHCDDCVSNAKLWAPLIVPAGMSTKEAEAWRKKEQSRMLGKR